MTAPDPEIAWRAQTLLLRMSASQATVKAAALDLRVAIHRFAKAFREAEDRDIAAVLFEHPDLVEMDLVDARWWAES